MLDEPHHDGSDLYVVERPDAIGGHATLRVRTPCGTAERVHLRYVADGESHLVEATIDEENGHETWWRASFAALNAATRYQWLLSGGRTGYQWLNGTGLAPRDRGGADDFVLGVGHDAPEWHLESVVYEIFPDRFASSGAAVAPPGWAEQRPWDAIPTGRGPTTPRERFGGDLAGIEQHLDHVESVGANLLYLTPIFAASSTHRYDAISFERIDPLLGGDAAFASLVAAAKARELRLVGDLTLNHTGSEHEWFRAALAERRAVERAFYLFDETLPAGYVSWLGHDSLPKLDWRSDELRLRMGDVVRRWLDAGLDGWRIDAANMLGRHGEVDVNQAVARWMRATAGGALLLAEHGNDFRRDLDGTGWHGVMNYSGFLRPVWSWLRGDHYETDVVSGGAPAPHYDGRAAVQVMNTFRAGVPWEATLHSWTLLDSHDTPRFATAAGSLGRHLVGIGLLMTSPGVPMIFAGDEIGLEGAWGEDARRTIPWDRPDTWDADLLAAYRRLAALRRSSGALARGGIRFAHVSDNAIAYLRETPDEQLLCLAARAPHRPIATPFTSLETLYGEDAAQGVLPADGPSFHLWRIH